MKPKAITFITHSPVNIIVKNKSSLLDISTTGSSSGAEK